MSLEEPGGAHNRRPRSWQAVRLSVFLIAILLLTGASILYSARGAGKGSSPARTATDSAGSPTPTATQVVATPAQALFYDTFLDNRNTWALSNQSGFLRILSGGRLSLTNTNPQTTLVESLPNNSQYGDFTMTVTFAMLGGDSNDSVGIYVRGDNNLDHDYRVEISGDGAFDIAKEYLDEQSMPQDLILFGPTNVPALRPPGQFNTMTATLQGPLISVSLNNTLISTVMDDDYTSGQAALFVRHGATSPGVTMSVSAIEIDSMQATG
jgi:3-keto-disaccharide hydrolase